MYNISTQHQHTTSAHNISTQHQHTISAHNISTQYQHTTETDVPHLVSVPLIPLELPRWQTLYKVGKQWQSGTSLFQTILNRKYIRQTNISLYWLYCSFLLKQFWLTRLSSCWYQTPYSHCKKPPSWLVCRLSWNLSIVDTPLHCIHVFSQIFGKAEYTIGIQFLINDTNKCTLDTHAYNQFYIPATYFDVIYPTLMELYTKI